HHHRLAQSILEFCTQRATDDVRRRARRERHDQLHWARGIGLGRSGGASEGEGEQRPAHQIFSVSPPRGCQTSSRRSASVTPQSSKSANTVSTRIPANTALISNVPSACRMR